MADAKTTLLCSIKFWAGAGMPGGAAPGRMTLRAGARTPARKQGFTPSELDKAERQLIKEGLIIRGEGTVGLTKRGISKAARGCSEVSLAPWDVESASNPKKNRGR